MNELDEKTGPIDDKGTAGPGVGQGRTITQSGTAQQKGSGKESQLSKIAAAVNPGSMAEANPTATQSMISTFMKTFESSAIEMREDTNDDQKELIKTMIDEITKLQTKNMKEFEKAIGKIVGISKDLQNSDNPILQKLGKDMEEKSREEVVKASGYTLTGEKDTFLNRLGRSVGMNTEEEPIEKNRQGIGKLAKGFGSSIGGSLKRGFNIAVGREAAEGSFADSVFTSDEQKRERLMNRIDSEANEKQSTSANDSFKKAIQEFFKDEKQKVQPKEKQKFKPIDKLTDLTEDQIKSLEEQGIAPASEKDISYRKEGKPVSKDEINKTLAASSEQQEDTAGISKDATIEALQKTADSNVLIQENSNIIQEKTTETVDVLKEILELMKKMSSESQSGGGSSGGGDDGGGDMDIDLPDRKRSKGRLRARARMASRGIRGRVGGLARGLVSGARTMGSAVLSGGARTLGMLGLGTAGTAGAVGAAGVGTAGAVGAAGAAGAGAAGAAGTAGTAGAGAAGAAGTAGTAAAATKSTGFLGKIAGGASSLGSKAGSILSKASPGLVKGLGFAGRVAGKLALPLAAGMAAYDGYKGFNADPNATTGQKFKNAGRNVLSGLTFGMVDSTEDKMAAGEYAGTQKKPKVGSIEPGAKKDTGSFFSKNKGAIAGAALGPVGMLAGAAYDKLSPSKSKTETGKNMDGALIEQGTAATKDKMQINVPPPTVINQGGGGGQAPPQITFPGGVGNVRSNDPTWLRFQERRAVA
jgi:hypothetical protein